MRPKTIIATIVLAVLPLFAVAAVQQSDHPAQQTTTEQNTGSWIMAGHGMYQGVMNIIGRVKADLGALANENDPAVLHNRPAQDQKLLNGIQMPMSATMQGMPGYMMSGRHIMYGGMMPGGMMSGSRYPGLDLYPHNSDTYGTLLGLKGDAHSDFLHILSKFLIVAGFFLLAAAWNVLYQAQREHRFAMTGPYARIRHPQYVGLIVSMLGFLLQWPTLPTLVMFPVLVWMYRKLARREEIDARAEAEFGTAYEAYAARTSAFLPRLAMPGENQTKPRRPGDALFHLAGGHWR
jgi:hypothetical protein